jgi:hypothetical protein
VLRLIVHSKTCAPRALNSFGRDLYPMRRPSRPAQPQGFVHICASRPTDYSKRIRFGLGELDGVEVIYGTQAQDQEQDSKPT